MRARMLAVCSPKKVRTSRDFMLLESGHAPHEASDLLQRLFFRYCERHEKVKDWTSGVLEENSR